MKARRNEQPDQPYPEVETTYWRARRNDSVIYIATLINPSDHRPVMVVNYTSYVYIGSPTDSPEEFIPAGAGYTGVDQEPSMSAGCIRVHVPAGVSIKGGGLGVMLYTGIGLTYGLAVAARNISRGSSYPDLLERYVRDLMVEGFSEDMARRYVSLLDRNSFLRDIARVHSNRDDSNEPCFGSASPRSADADRFWERQLNYGYAYEIGNESDTISDQEVCFNVYKDLEAVVGDEWDDRNVVGVHPSSYDDEVCTSVDIEVEGRAFQVINVSEPFKRGWVLHANPLLGYYFSDDWKIPPVDVLLGIDLRGSRSPGLMAYMMDLLRSQGADEETVEEWIARNTSLPAGGVVVMGDLPYTSLAEGFAVNPGRRGRGRQRGRRNPPAPPIRNQAAWDAFFGTDFTRGDFTRGD